jgi:hypothetical protein
MREFLVNIRENKDFVRELSQKVTSWGISIIPDPEKPCQSRPIAVSLMPRTFKKVLFDKACDVNAAFNRLIDAISIDVDWLIDAHNGMLQFCVLSKILHFRSYTL